jgi:hypothetical protein
MPIRSTLPVVRRTFDKFCYELQPTTAEVRSLIRLVAEVVESSPP